jgi:hypothetical protein
MTIYTRPLIGSSIRVLIEHMINHGSSMTISWGEDTGCYEVDWITSGKRFRGVDRNLLTAAHQVISNAADHFGIVG